MEPLIIGAVLLNAYAFILVVARGPIYRTKIYRPMLWNIWLSVIPILVLSIGGIGGLILVRFSPITATLTLAVTFLVWLLLLPNASYLITELNLSHRKENDPVPLWYDIILVISLAMSGVVNTVLNVFIVHIVISTSLFGDSGKSLIQPGILAGVFVVIMLLGFGMYLGRYPRFNSWDLKHPISFVRKLMAHFSERGNVAACAGFTVTYSVFLTIIYLVMAGPVIIGLIRLEQIRSLVS